MPLPLALPATPPVALTPGVITVSALFTNAGLTLLATALQSQPASSAITYVDIVPGCGTLSAPVSSGTPITSLPLTLALPVSLAAGQSLTLTDGTNSETVTVAGGGAAGGATSIAITSWTPAHSYAASTTGITPTPATTDSGLYNGSAAGVRVGATPGSAGSNPGESLNSAYFDGTQATAVYMSVGYFGGSSASSTPGTGVLIAEDVQYWNHVQNADSASFQLDSTI